MKKTSLFLAATITLVAGAAYANPDDKINNPYVATKTVTTYSPETGAPRQAVVISEGSNPGLYQGIQSPGDSSGAAASSGAAGAGSAGSAGTGAGSAGSCK